MTCSFGTSRDSVGVQHLSASAPVPRDEGSKSIGQCGVISNVKLANRQPPSRLVEEVVLGR